MISKERNFLICAPSYSENNGGAIVLHKLCSLINQNGGHAYLFPFTDNFEFNKFNYKKVLFKFFKKHLREPFRKFKLNPTFQTPVIKKLPIDISSDSWIVVYPEIIFGNPLNGKNIVRWLLHNPGFNPETGKDTNNFFFGKNELYFRIGSWFKNFEYPGSVTSKNFLQIFHMPLDLYNNKNTSHHRNGVAYLLRKGEAKKIIHDLDTSIRIDGKKHEEIAHIFKSVKTFISYDPYSTYSVFAALCDCDSIVVPDENVTEEQWMPQPERRYGIAYGFENLEKSRLTRHLVVNRYLESEKLYKKNVAEFIEESNNFFDRLTCNV